jgi:hypothetical protein
VSEICATELNPNAEAMSLTVSVDPLMIES